ncbi:MAG: hypothetical protein EPN85_13045 [Bacteroidetes bacterium]|nr:MAG: hypothetical protein EPN85_13045 [Bacteroidota bacterium]
MKIKITFTLFLTVAVLITRCKKESVDSIQCDTTGWIPDSIRYSNTVAPILSQHCTGCHNSTIMQGNVNLSGYDNAKKYADNDLLLGTMAHLKHYKKMPNDGTKVSHDKICKVKFWIDNGALNN